MCFLWFLLYATCVMDLFINFNFKFLVIFLMDVVNYPLDLSAGKMGWNYFKYINKYELVDNLV